MLSGKLKSSIIAIIFLIIFDIILLSILFTLGTLAYLEALRGSTNFVYYCTSDTLLVLFIPIVLTATVISANVSLKGDGKRTDLSDIQMESLNQSALEETITYRYVTIKFENENQLIVGHDRNSPDSGSSDAEIRPVANAQTNYKAYVLLHNESIPEFSTFGLRNRCATFRIEAQGNKDIGSSQVTIETDNKPKESSILFKFAKLRPNTIVSSIAVYFCLLLFLLSVSSLLWAVCISVYFNAQYYKLGWTYAVVDIISGFITPVLLLVSATLFSLIIAYFTNNELNLREMLPLVLNSVKLINNPNGTQSYIVANRFRYDITVTNCPKTKLSKFFSERPWIETHFSTWTLWLLFCLTFLFAYTQFISLTVIDERTSDTCITSFDCFIPINTIDFEHVICNTSNNTIFAKNGSIFKINNDNTDNTVFYCFKFILGFGVGGNIFLAIGSSFALFLFGIKIIVVIFNVLSIAIHIKQSWIWSLSLFLLGFIGLGSIFLIYILNSAHTLLFNMLRFVGVFIISLYFIVIGLLSLSYFKQDDWKESKKMKHS